MAKAAPGGSGGSWVVWIPADVSSLIDRTTNIAALRCDGPVCRTFSIWSLFPSFNQYLPAPYLYRWLAAAAATFLLLPPRVNPPCTASFVCSHPFTTATAKLLVISLLLSFRMLLPVRFPPQFVAVVD